MRYHGKSYLTAEGESTGEEGKSRGKGRKTLKWRTTNQPCSSAQF